MSTTTKRANHLIKEKSPYLLQHAYNPVRWYPWSEEAFSKAATENKPVFLSIGYSTCHWCHVMERESFEDEEVAVLLNKHFVSIKVDREERPDLDHIYMTACQALTGQGGWPLSVFLAPDKKPFYAGTYFPKHSRFGRPGFMELLAHINQQWRANQAKLLEAGQQLTEALQPQLTSTSPGELNSAAVTDAVEILQKGFDPQYGGFGRAPKFPTPHNLTLLLRHWHKTGDARSLEMVEKTLQSMHAGGIYDHLGYGFSRYSVDKEWLVPHFEKMLYDNALLAIAYLEAYQATGKGEYGQVARDVFSYVLRDMTAPQGGFYSAEDADSEGEEGKFYIWTPQQLVSVLGQELGEKIGQYYDVTPDGNFEGKNILNRINAKPVNISAEELEMARYKLFAFRKQRVHPHKDDKILTAWNGLMVAAFALGARVLGEKQYLEAAQDAVEFVWHNLLTPQGRLLARWRDGEAAFLGYLDDHVFLIWGLIELYQAHGDPKWLAKAVHLQEEQDNLFWDNTAGGYFFSGTDAEELLARPKEIYDGALPSGNSVGALNLLRLARLTGREQWEQQAHQIFSSFAGTVASYPAGYSQLLQALSFALEASREVVVVTASDRKDIWEIITTFGSYFSPETVFLYHTPTTQELVELAPFVAEMSLQRGETTYYVCENHACRQPTTSIQQVEKLLGQGLKNTRKV